MPGVSVTAVECKLPSHLGGGGVESFLMRYIFFLPKQIDTYEDNMGGG